jgi:hypothetical protein
MKNDVFNFNRFGRYLVTDTKNAINRYGISLLVLAAFSFAGYLLAGLFSSVVNGSWYSMPVAGRVTIFLFVTTIVLAMAPAKMFGFITDKKEGSDFLMLPASPLEKTISMVIISCIFMPLVFFAVYLSLDLVLCMIDINCGDSLVVSIHEFRYDSVAQVARSMQPDENFVLTRPSVLCDDVAQFVLIFLLGALLFKTSKTAKTIGCMIILSVILVMIAIPLLTSGAFDVLKEAIVNGMTPDEMLSEFPVMAWISRHPLLTDFISDTIVNVILFLLIWLRVKRIKH